MTRDSAPIRRVGRLRRSHGVVALLACAWAWCAPGLGAQPPRAAGGEDRVVREARARLLKEFEAFLARPKGFAATVRKECRAFPEGDLLPYTFPAMAYANLAVGAPGEYQGLARKRVAQLIDLALPGVVRRVRPPGGDLARLREFNKQAVYLGNLNLVLGCYRLVGGDGRFEGIHAAVSTVLHDALVRRKGRPLESYPDASWPFDTIPCVLSLHLRDLHTGRGRSREIIARHLQWVRDRATDKALRLPYSHLSTRPGRPHTPPRGGDLALRISLVAHVDRAYAAQLYRDYVRSYWRDRALICGFAEWPPGHEGWQDVDSGPIVLGVGASATGLGVGAAIAMNDRARRDRLVGQVAGMKKLMRTLLALHPQRKDAWTFDGLIDPDSDYETGFLFGDACLFYSLTHVPWSRQRNAPERK